MKVENWKDKSINYYNYPYWTRITLDKENIDLHKIITETKNRLELITEQKNGSIKLLLGLDNSVIEGDYSQISNSIYNLVENALKYSGKNPQITISTYSEKNKKYISVRDKGEGIPLELSHKIFNRFFRIQEKNQYKGKGFGIGLSYVKTVIKMHKGKVFINPGYSEGCEMIIEL